MDLTAVLTALGTLVTALGGWYAIWGRRQLSERKMYLTEMKNLVDRERADREASQKELDYLRERVQQLEAASANDHQRIETMQRREAGMQREIDILKHYPEKQMFIDAVRAMEERVKKVEEKINGGHE